MSEPKVLLDGLGFPESTRWHDGRAWLCNWGAGEVLAVTDDGKHEVMANLARETIPLSIDWLPDGRMLIVDGTGGRLLRQEPDESLLTVADLTAAGRPPFNELVVAADGTAYVNGGPGIVCVRPDGGMSVVAQGLQWPNGMAIIDDGRTLMVADSHLKQLLAFSVAGDGTLSGRRTWADLQYAPDGICADADGAVWVATVPGERCERVREGGEVVSTVVVDRGCFACMLGGEDGRTLYIAAAQWPGMTVAMTEGPNWTGQLLAAPGQPASHSGRP